MTYKQAYDKIIEAYFKDEIQPYDNKFCFCGTLAPDEYWRFEKKFDHNAGKYIINLVKYSYAIQEFLNMEEALLNTIKNEMGFCGDMFDPVNDSGEEIDIDDDIIEADGFEDALFAGMAAAIEVLKEIHRARGEDVDGLPVFTKRELINQ